MPAAHDPMPADRDAAELRYAGPATQVPAKRKDWPPALYCGLGSLIAPVLGLLFLVVGIKPFVMLFLLAAPIVAFIGMVLGIAELFVDRRRGLAAIGLVLSLTTLAIYGAGIYWLGQVFQDLH